MIGWSGGVKKLIQGTPVDWIPVLVPFALLGLYFWGRAMAKAGSRKSIAALVECKCKMCLRCRYSLSGLEETNVCPECGAPFTPQALVDGWNTTYPLLRYPQTPSSS